MLPRVLIVVATICGAMFSGFGTVSADTPTVHHLDYNGGLIDGIVKNPEIHIVFASPGGTAGWDSSVPEVFSEASLKQMMTKLLVSGFLDAAAQYGVDNGSLIQSTTNNGCNGAPSGASSETGIAEWIYCEVQSPGTGIDWPNDNSIYVVFLLPSVNVSVDGKSDCKGALAYHSSSANLSLDPQLYPFIVIPTMCAYNDPHELSVMLSHELIEATTDPIPFTGWLDNNSNDSNSQREAADICSQNYDGVYLADGLKVARYWSNQDNSCWPLVHTVKLNVDGSRTTAPIDVVNQSAYGDLNVHTITAKPEKTLTVRDGADVSWQFVSPLAVDSAQTTIADATDNTARHTLLGLRHDWTDTATYYRADRLTITTYPTIVGQVYPALHHTEWPKEGTKTTLTAPEYVQISPDQRARFDSWGVDSITTDLSVDVQMTGPETATAFYSLENKVMFTQSGIPEGVPWNVTVNGGANPGPFSDWFDVGSSLSFSFPDIVPSPTDPDTRYALTGTSIPSPLAVSSGSDTAPVIAYYTTQHLLTIDSSNLPDPNLSAVTNNGVTLGSVDDTAPLQVWLNDGSSVSLDADSVVNGVDGTQYFLAEINPLPPTELTTPFTTTITYETMNQVINDAVAQGGISDHGSNGISNSFKQQFGKAQTAIAAKRYSDALGALTAFVNHVAAQNGKKISPATASKLQLNAFLVYHNALCLGAGSLTGTHVSNDYAYYAQSVMRLGGTVLPPCSASSSTS